MENSGLALLSKFGLAENQAYNYSEVSNSFLGQGYTSLAGNTYFNSVRFLEGIVIKEDVGQGYLYTFINGIRIYDIQGKTLLCERYYHSTIYDNNFLKNEVISMLIKLITEAAEKERIPIDSYEVRCRIRRIVTKAFNADQREILLNLTSNYLNE